MCAFACLQGVCLEFTACVRVHVWAYASVHGSVHVCDRVVWSVYVCVSLLGSHWTDPQPFLNTETASFFMCSLLQTQFPWNWLFFGSFRVACTVNGFSGVCQGPVGADWKTKRDKERLTDPKLPPCPRSPSKQFLFWILAQTKAIIIMWKNNNNNLQNKSLSLIVLSYWPSASIDLLVVLCKQWWCGAITLVLFNTAKCMIMENGKWFQFQ